MIDNLVYIQGSSSVLIPKSVTENGTYYASSDEADGYSSVEVDVQPNLGTKSISDNGTYSASSDELDGYSSVTVDVQPDLDGKTVTDNGTYYANDDNLDGYSSVTVNLPLNTKSIITNGTYNASGDNLKGYSSVSVNVAPNVTTKSISTNGTYNASSDSVDGYSQVTVSVQPNVDTKSISTNGTYTASTENLDGYSSVTVSVQPNVDTKSITTNGTYNASSDNLDGYSSVTVSVPGMVDITQTDYDALPDAQKKNGSIYRILKNYEYHVSNDGDIVVKIGSGKTLWYFIGKYVNQEVSIPSELQSYKPTVSQLVQASKSYTDGGITQNGWVGFYNNYIRFWSTDWASLQAGYTYGVVDPNNDTNLQTLVYESPYNYRTYYVFYYMGEEYFTEPENIQPNYNWYMNDDQTLAVRVKVSDGSYRWYFNDYVEAGTPLPATDTNHWIPPILSKFFIQQSSMPITVTDSRGRNWTCNTVKVQSACSIRTSGGTYVNGQANLIVGSTYNAQARGYNEYSTNLQSGTIRAIIESTDIGNWDLIGSQANGTAYKNVSHTWVAPTFDPING